MSELSRREFVIAAAAVCGTCGALLSPSVLAAEKAEPVDVGELSQFGEEGIYDEFVTKHKFLVVRQGELLYAMTALCTHRNYLMTVRGKDRDRIECSKHGSRFDLEGVVLKGPAKLALPRYGIRLDQRGHVMVDPSKRYEEKQCEDAGSYLKVVPPAE